MSEIQPSVTPSPASAAAALTDRSSYVEWGSVFGGALLTMASAFLLLTFGSAIGLSVVSPWSNPGTVAKVLGFGTAIWFILVQIASFAAGGYLSGRMRAKRGDATKEEVEVRDGMQGIVVWAVAVVISALFAASTAVSLAKSGAQIGAAVASSATDAASTVASQAAGSDLTGYFADKLYRSEASSNGRSTDPQAEVVRILGAGAVQGEISESDRAYLAQTVAAQTGMAPEAAQQRVNEVLSEIEQAAETAKVKAREAANTSRKVAAVTGFLVAATLFISGVAAWWAAGVGGQHREAGTFPLFTTRRRT